MSIAEKASPTSAGSHSAAAAVPPSKAIHARIRKGQRLDEVRYAEEAQAMASVSSSSPSSLRASSSSSANSPPPSSTSSSPSSSPSASAPSTSTLAAIDSPFQLQEYLALLVRRDPHDVERVVALPPASELDASTTGTTSPRTKSKHEASASTMSEDDGALQPVDPDVWVYEQLRRLVLDLSTPWITSLQQECDKHANPQTCGAMNAGDWMFLCASHGEEKQCCAIDYMVHTLDGATSLLNSARHFPSRTYVPSTSLRHFGAITRRLSRIFVHAWCYHRDTFDACEAETSLYARFYHLVETYDLSSTDNLPPPSHAGSSRDGIASLDGEGADAQQRDEDLVSRHMLSGPNTLLNGKKGVDSPTVARKSKSPRSLEHLRALESSTTSRDGGDPGLIPPPAPSPRPAAILQRSELEDDEEQQPPPPLACANGWAAQVDAAKDLHRSDSAASAKTAIYIGDWSHNSEQVDKRGQGEANGKQDRAAEQAAATAGGK
ncbi:hypothetical protein ACQY0O_003988 [Thecaphora frezii]